MSTSLQLSFINQSNDRGMSNIVFFQKNEAEKDDNWIAWRIAKNCGYKNFLPLVYEWDIEINLVDWNGNHSPRQKAYWGTSFQIIPQPFGKTLSAIGCSNNPTEISVENRLTKGAMHINLYRSGYLVAQRKNLTPGQLTKFRLANRLYIASLPGINEGNIISKDRMLSHPTEFFLTGIASADILMLGGEVGDAATAQHFELTKVNNL